MCGSIDLEDNEAMRGIRLEGPEGRHPNRSENTTDASWRTSGAV